MHLRGVGRQFFAALFVLMAALSAVVYSGLRGLGDVDTANEQVFVDNLQTTQATAKLGADPPRAPA